MTHKYYIMEGVHGAYHAARIGTRTTVCGLTGYSLQPRRRLTKVTCTKCKATIVAKRKEH